jgi:hypothetical protein
MRTKYFLFKAAIIFFLSYESFAQDPKWVKENTWYFDNFVKDTLPWTAFRETFIGVAPQPSGDFDLLFYKELYSTKLADKGHCFGMDVMALMMKKNGGYLGFCHPPYVYSGTIDTPSPTTNDTIGPADKNLETALDIIHGNQINHGFLSFLLDVIAIGKNRDGRYAFQQVNYYLAKDDPPVVSITKSFSPADGGHVLIPFYTQDLGATKRLYVYDPDRTYYKSGADGKDFYENKNNFIEINSSSGEWKYTRASGSTWTGNPGGGGNLICIPLSIAGKKDRLPQSLLAEGSYALNTIFTYGDVKIEQISDPASQKHLFKPNSKEWETDEHVQLKSVLPFIPLDGNSFVKPGRKSACYFTRGQTALDFQFRAYGDYRITWIFQGRIMELKGASNSAVQHFRLDDFSKEKKN